MATHKNHKFSKRLTFAFSGIRHALKSEKSFRTHIIISLGLFVFSIFFQPNYTWLAIFCLCIGVVMSLELVNSAIESLCDKVSQQEDPAIKIAKDCAAGAVLISSMASVLIFIMFLLSN